MKIIKKLLKICIYLLALVLLVECAARIKLFLQTKQYKFLLYHNKITISSDTSFRNERLLRAFQFKKVENKDDTVNITLFGTSVIESIFNDLGNLLIKEGLNAPAYLDCRRCLVIEFDDNSIIIFESMLTISTYHDFFNRRNKIKRIIGEPLYSNLYNNSVFFLMLSEKLAGRISFAEAVVQEFLDETSKTYNEILRTVEDENVPVLFVIFPNYLAKGGSELFEAHCARVVDLAVEQLKPLLEEYSVPYLDLHASHIGEFQQEAFPTDCIHLKGEGAERAAGYILQVMKENFTLHK